MAETHAHEHGHDHAHEHEHEHHGPPRGIMRWIRTTNHKDLGTLYLWFSFTMFFIGGVMSLIIRAELYKPGLQFVDPAFFNEITTLHALVMIFGGVMPGFVGLANWLVPMMVGCSDLALPRVNNWGFWILPFAFTLLLSTFFLPGGGPAGGWTLYPPLVLQTGAAFPFLIFAIHLMGISSITGGINIIVTILNMRAPGMTLMKNAAVRVDLADHRLPADRGDAGAGGCGDHAADRQVLRHQLLQCRRRRRPGDVRTHLLVLRPPRGVHHDPAGVRDHLARSSRPSRASRCSAMPRWSTPPRRSRSCSFIVWAHHMFTVGHAVAGRAVLHVQHHADRGAHGREGVQLAGDDVAGLDDLRNADAVRHRLRVPVHHRRLLRPDAGAGAGGLPVPQHLLRGGAFPLRAGAGCGVRDHRGGLLLDPQVDRA